MWGSVRRAAPQLAPSLAEAEVQLLAQPLAELRVRSRRPGVGKN